MTTKKLLSPRGYFRKIVLLIEAQAPRYSAGWWNIDRDKPVMSKSDFREIYKLAKLGLRASIPPRAASHASTTEEK